MILYPLNTILLIMLLFCFWNEIILRRHSYLMQSDPEISGARIWTVSTGLVTNGLSCVWCFIALLARHYFKTASSACRIPVEATVVRPDWPPRRAGHGTLSFFKLKNSLYSSHLRFVITIQVTSNWQIDIIKTNLNQFELEITCIHKNNISALTASWDTGLRVVVVWDVKVSSWCRLWRLTHQEGEAAVITDHRDHLLPSTPASLHILTRQHCLPR